MTEIERLILQGMDIMMRTQQIPRGGDAALYEHVRKLTEDMDEWGRDLAALTTKDVQRCY